MVVSFMVKKIIFLIAITQPKAKWMKEIHLTLKFSHPDCSLNRKTERFKIFEVEPRSNRDDVIINLIIN